MPNKTFSQELQELINRHSRENESNTPDYVLAGVMEGVLSLFETAVKARDVHNNLDKEDEAESTVDRDRHAYYAIWRCVGDLEIVMCNTELAAIQRLIHVYEKNDPKESIIGVVGPYGQMVRTFVEMYVRYDEIIDVDQNYRSTSAAHDNDGKVDPFA